MSKIFKAFKAASPVGAANISGMAHQSYKYTQGRILKRGVIGTLGAAAGAAIGADIANDYPRQRKSDIQKGAIAGAALGLGVTAAILARRPIKTIVSALGAGTIEGGRVFFRRIRGRIIPIRVK